jgi:hypothetical protein
LRRWLKSTAEYDKSGLASFPITVSASTLQHNAKDNSLVVVLEVVVVLVLVLLLVLELDVVEVVLDVEVVEEELVLVEVVVVGQPYLIRGETTNLNASSAIARFLSSVLVQNSISRTPSGPTIPAISHCKRLFSMWSP